MVTATYPIAPTVTPVKGTLLDAATVTDDFEWLDGRDLFETFNCMKFGASADFCGPNTKDFDQSAGWVDGVRFAAYGGVVCKAIGLDQQRMQSEVERVFKAGESTAVERAVVEQLLPNADIWNGAEDITPVSGAVSPAVGVALLEGYAGGLYVGAPTIHMPRTIASIMLAVNGLEFSGDVLHTRLGAKVAAGAGYENPSVGPDGTTAAAAGEMWLYATGEVFVGRSEAVIRQVMEQSTNDVYVLAERGYIAAAECFAAAIRVKVQ